MSSSRWLVASFEYHGPLRFWVLEKEWFFLPFHAWALWDIANEEREVKRTHELLINLYKISMRIRGKPFLANYYFGDLAFNIDIRICIRIFHSVHLNWCFWFSISRSNVVSHPKYIFIANPYLSAQGIPCAERYGFAMKIIYILFEERL